MNFIGHALLAQRGGDDFLFGNLIADGIKGSDLSALPDETARGVRWHRRVDRTIDHHPIVLTLATRMPERRFAGIALDLVWDHFLSRDHLSPALAERCYRLLGTRAIPERLGTLVPRLVEGRWLERYANFDFCCEAITGIGTRLRHTGYNRLAAMIPWLRTHHAELEHEYRQLWPQLLVQCEAPG